MRREEEEEEEERRRVIGPGGQATHLRIIHQTINHQIAPFSFTGARRLSPPFPKTHRPSYCPQVPKRPIPPASRRTSWTFP
jgi:hypothetical protein